MVGNAMKETAKKDIVKMLRIRGLISEMMTPYGRELKFSDGAVLNLADQDTEIDYLRIIAFCEAAKGRDMMTYGERYDKWISDEMNHYNCKQDFIDMLENVAEDAIKDYERKRWEESYRELEKC